MVAVKYSENQINEINRLIKDSSLNQTQISEAVNKKFPKAPNQVSPSTVTHYSKKYFKVPTGGALNNAYKKRFSGVLTTKEGTEKLLKELTKNSELKKAITKDFKAGMTLENIRTKYRAGGAGASLMPANVPKMGKEMVKRLIESYGLERAGGAELRKVDVTSDKAKNLAKEIRRLYNNPKLSRAAANTQLGLTPAEVKKFEKRWNEKNPKNPLFTKRINQPFEGAGQQTKRFKDTTTKLQEFQNYLKKNSSKSYRSGTPELAKLVKNSGYTPIGFNSALGKLRSIYKGGERPNFKIDPSVKNVINTKFPLSTALTKDVLLDAGYTPKQIAKMDNVQNIIRKLNLNQGVFLNQLEHKIPKSVAVELLNKNKISKTEYKNLVGKISPATSYLNQWKKQYDFARLNNLKQFLNEEIDFKKFNKIENDIIKEAKKISGGYDIGKINILDDGNINIQSPDEVFTSKNKGIGSQSRGLIDFQKNLVYHNNIAKAYNKNPNASGFGTLRGYADGKKIPIFDDSIGKQISKLTTNEDFTKYLANNTDGDLFKGIAKLGTSAQKAKLLKYAKLGGKTALLSSIPTFLMAGESDLFKSDDTPTYNNEIGAFVKPGTDEVESQSGLLDWAAKNPEPLVAGAALGGAGLTTAGNTLLKGLLKTMATPALSAGYAASEIADNLKSGDNILEAVADKSAGVGLMGSRAFSGGLGALFGGARIARALTPIGATMTAAGLGKDYYEFAQDEIDKMNQMSDYDRRIYNEMLMDDTNIDF